MCPKIDTDLFLSAHKKSSRKERCPRGAEDDALQIPGAGGLEFDGDMGVLAGIVEHIHDLLG